MAHRHLHLILVLAVLAVSTATRGARAWVETSIRSHTATVDLTRAGSATVTHELVVKVRGGPLKSLSIDGVDDDAELDPDATVGHLRGTESSAWPLLVHKSDAASVTLEVDDPKGLRAGVYRFRFGYRSNFMERDLLEQRGASVSVTWAGPRLGDGIDSAKAVFRLPKSDSTPRLPELTGDEAVEAGLEGLLVSQLRRTADKDELELVRTHVAKGEPAVWRVQTGARAFDAFTPPERSAAAASAPALGPAPLGISWLLAALFVTFSYAGLVALKWSSSSRALSTKGAKPRALFPLPATLRAALSGLLLGGALLSALTLMLPTLAGVLLVVSMLFACQLPPSVSHKMRGPGSWHRLSDGEAVQARPTRLPGRWLELGSLPGFCVFVVALGAFCVLALLLFSRAPYQALVTALGSASLLPIFCTGQHGELPPDCVARPRKFFASLARQLRREPGWQVTLLARMPLEQDEPDELRLLIEPQPMPPGLVALEIGLEYQVGSGAVVDLPCLIVRVRDDSPAYYALPRSVVWSRGRTSGERVALLRPKLPTRALCMELVREVVATLCAPPVRAQSQRPASKSSLRSWGSGLSTSKSRMSPLAARM